MNARFVLLADDAYLGDKGKLSADGIFEEIQAENFPFMHKRLVVAVRFEGSKNETGDHNCKINLLDTKNRVIFSTGDIVFKLGGIGPIYAAGVISTIRNILLKHPGGYRFSIFVDNRYITSVAFTVRKQQIIPVNPGAVA